MGVRLGDLPEILKPLPRLSVAELDDFAKDLEAIRTQFNTEELRDPGAAPAGGITPVSDVQSPPPETARSR